MPLYYDELDSKLFDEPGEGRVEVEPGSDMTVIFTFERSYSVDVTYDGKEPSEDLMDRIFDELMLEIENNPVVFDGSELADEIVERPYKAHK